ncbi:probable UDP-N-acetylglucosamine--peptide N-acetylglucosaminyltransferase SEC [Phragmites australis]|uniref:probable UDP-N-acetylglucosamine--peptide N-acetylglucosaminyltransferase SEC n=1 Tax=Phragmites australis TaxID=29695 RepID=UPI002D776BE1|nr:probable UDP-N-acetylglucosamine--peptide N-acetylglucosaminyltransferase SEC [Phragmites australis]
MCIAKNDEAVAIQPNFPECFNNMANALRVQEKSDVDRAIQYYEHAIKIRPTFADAFTNLANAYIRKGNLTEASKCCHQSLALNPRLVDALKAQDLSEKHTIAIGG